MVPKYPCQNKKDKKEEKDNKHEKHEKDEKDKKNQKQLVCGQPPRVFRFQVGQRVECLVMESDRGGVWEQGVVEELDYHHMCGHCRMLHQSAYLVNLDSGEQCKSSIDDDTMVEINDELKNFITNKEDVYKILAINDKRLREALDKIKLTKLTAFFTGKCSALQTFKCKWCPRECPSKASRGAHECRCKFNPDHIPIPEKKPIKKASKKPSLNTEQCMEKLEQQISINTEQQSSDSNTD